VEQNSNILKVLDKWNFWNGVVKGVGVERDDLNRISKFLDGPEVIALKGVRRAGKSTLMRQLMNMLLKTGVDPRKLFYLNLDEPYFSGDRTVEFLERVFQTYREHVNPTGDTFVFIDEVQEMPGWERWVRSKNELKEAKIFVTGSSSSLMDSEYATLLTGRNITFSVYPLAFKEFIRFKGLELPGGELELTSQKTVLRNLLNEYINFGGFPEVVLKSDTDTKELLLKQYFYDILYRDVAARHKVRDTETLKNIAVYYMTNISNLSSYTRIKNLLGVPMEVARSYSSHLASANLISEVPRHSFKVLEQARNPKKVYSIDTGLRNAVAFKFSEDFGRLAENIVFSELKKDGGELFYFKDGQEVDFLVREGLKAVSIVQVSMLDSSQGKAMDRELAVLDRCAEKSGCNDAILVTDDLEAELPTGKVRVRAIPLWKWLLR